MVENLVRLPLGEAAAAVRKHPSTLTKAANHKDSERRLKFSLDENGERLFAVDDLLARFGKLYLPDESKTDSPVQSLMKKIKKEGNSPVRTSELKKSEAEEFTGDSLVHLKEIHEMRTSALEEKITSLKDNNRQLQGEVDSWKTQADNWRKHADQNLRLLTDQREEPTATPEPATPIVTPQPSRLPLVAAVLIVGILGAGVFLYPDFVREKFQSLTSSIMSEKVATISE